MNLLFCGDAGVQSGFSRVTHAICDRLYAHHGWNVSILAVNHSGDWVDTPHRLYPAGRGMDYVGLWRYADLVEKVKPDIVLVLNDGWIAEKFVTLHRKQKFSMPIITYIPVDAKNFHPDWAKGLSAADLTIWYTQFGKDQATLSGLDCPTAIIPHGVDTELFRPMDRAEARKAIGLPPGFIFGNVNRNQPRKRQDLSIQYFAEWIKTRAVAQNVYLYLHCAQQDGGWDLPELAQWYGIADRLIMPGLGLTPCNGVKESSMPLIYNALDAQITTTEGEGWGLTQFEGMACRMPQIMPDYAALGEWAAGAALFVPCTASSHSIGMINTIGGIVDGPLFVEALDRMYRDATLRDELGAAGLARAREPQFQWDRIASQFNGCLTQLVEARRAA